MKKPGQSDKETFFKTCAIAILIVSLVLAGKNTPPNNEKAPVSPIHSTKNHNLQAGDA